ncbi:MAG: aminotransferase class III-fold pyridoxal phosphate-dependent enzyme [Gammaproteobacteria bacterium]
MHVWYYILYTVIALYVLRKIVIRLQLSKAKHPSLTGHSKMSRRVSKLIPYYEIGEDRIFNCDGAPKDVADRRRASFEKLAAQFRNKSPKSIAASEELEESISDVLFTNTYRVPFQYSRYVKKHLKLGTVVNASSGTRVRDIDGNWSYDLTGSYGANVFGYDFYKECMEKGIERVNELGPVLGPYHPLIIENVQKLKAISGLDEVSFHMSGTEAVMQAVRLARYHTGKSHLVRFCGAYHGWWDGVQPGIGNQRPTSDVYTLKDMDKDTLRVLRTRKDIACILINPLQAMHPNTNAPGDSMLIASGRNAHYDRDAYTRWLQQLRQVCDERGIVMIMDEVFVGFRLAYGGAQEYFRVKADMVTYGKTLGGGLPVGVVCGKHRLMKRFKDNRPVQICFARGTFNSHPYVMASMNEFLRRIEDPAIRSSYEQIDELWNNRVAELNRRLADQQLPVKIVNLASIWTILYTVPSRYNWVFQYYLRAQGLAISWIGSGRMIMSHNFTDEDYEAVMQRFVAAAEAMKNDGWWWQNAALTNKAIKKQIFREMVASIFIR